MKVAEICRAIERWVPPGFAYAWDRAGLNLGGMDWHASSILVTLTVTDAAVCEAVQKQVGLIVSHHPLIWEPMKNLTTEDPVAKRCMELVKAGIACYSAHTNLDVAPGGVNDILADKLGLVDRKPLAPIPQHEYVKLITFVPESHLPEVRSAVCEAGAGVIGDYTYCTFSVPGTGTFVPAACADPYSGKKGMLNEEPELRFEVRVDKAHLPIVIEALRSAHPYEEPAYDLFPLANRDQQCGIGVIGRIAPERSLKEFAKSICAALDLDNVQMSGDGERIISRVGVLGGAGGAMIKQMPPDIDVLITADIGYHDALAARDKNLALIDAGHDGLENVIVPALAQFLEMYFPELRVYVHIEPELFRNIGRK